MANKYVRMAYVFAIVVGFSLGAMPNVRAHVVAVSTFGYVSSSNCTWIRAEISDGGPAQTGYSRTDVESRYQLQTPYGSYDCRDYFARPPGLIRAQNVLLKYTYPSGTWAYCTESIWYANGTTASTLAVGTYWRNKCGIGETYATLSKGDVFVNSQWYGWPLQSAGHWFPN